MSSAYDLPGNPSLADLAKRAKRIDMIPPPDAGNAVLRHDALVREVESLHKQLAAAQQTCPHVVSSGEGTNYCDLAESSVKDLTAKLTAAQADRDAAKAEALKWRRIRTPTHGSCCTCQACGQYYDDCRCSLDEVADELTAAQAEIAAATSLLPDTYFADRPLAERVGFMVAHWRKLVPLCEQFEAEIAALREALTHLKGRFGGRWWHKEPGEPHVDPNSYATVGEAIDRLLAAPKGD